MQERHLATSITVDELRARALRLPLFSERPVGSYRPDLAATLDVPETTHRLSAEPRHNLRLVERPVVCAGQPMLAQMAS